MKREPIDLVTDATECCGCGACVEVCSQEAIAMQPAADGCMYPVIAKNICIGCARCIQQCGYRQVQQLNAPITVYAAVAKDRALVKQSSSGGAFSAVARSWVKSGGLVAGAVMDCDQEVKVYHVLSDHPVDLQRMQGSKYAQSEAWRCYRSVKAALVAGRQVLFSGTPCQVAAIKKLTGNPHNLITIDLICHGVPSAKMLDEYVRILDKRFHGNVVGLSFRDKAMQKSYSARIDVRYRNRIRHFYLRSNDMSFYEYFLLSANCRENCYSCPYARADRVSDLTIGDYWGIKKLHAADFQGGVMPQVADWSCVLVNTSKGQWLIEEHAKEIDIFPSKLDWIAAENHQLRHPTIVPDCREEVKNRYIHNGYECVEKAFIQARGGWLRYYLRLVRNLYRNYRRVQKNRQ